MALLLSAVDQILVPKNRERANVLAFKLVIAAGTRRPKNRAKRYPPDLRRPLGARTAGDVISEAEQLITAN
jgi:hypothetical protein